MISKGKFLKRFYDDVKHFCCCRFNRNFMKVLTSTNMTAINGKTEVLPFVSNQMHMIKKGLIVGTALTLIMKFMSKEVKARVRVFKVYNFVFIFFSNFR